MTTNVPQSISRADQETVSTPINRDPLFSRERSIIPKGKSTYISLPDPTAEILGLEETDLATVSILDSDDVVDEIVITPTRRGPIVLPGVGFQRSVYDHDGTLEINIPSPAGCDPGQPWRIDVYQSFIHLVKIQ